MPTPRQLLLQPPTVRELARLPNPPINQPTKTRKLRMMLHVFATRLTVYRTPENPDGGKTQKTKGKLYLFESRIFPFVHFNTFIPYINY